MHTYTNDYLHVISSLTPHATACQLSVIIRDHYSYHQFRRIGLPQSLATTPQLIINRPHLTLTVR